MSNNQSNETKANALNADEASQKFTGKSKAFQLDFIVNDPLKITLDFSDIYLPYETISTNVEVCINKLNKEKNFQFKDDEMKNCLTKMKMVQNMNLTNNSFI